MLAPDELTRLLGVGEDATPAEVSSAFEERRAALQGRLDDDALEAQERTELELELTRLAEAHQVVLEKTLATVGRPDVVPAQPVPTVAPGSVLVGRYEVERALAAGGMGAVFIANDRVRGERVAIKVVHAHLLGVPQVRDRFLDEARLTSRLTHPNIVNVFDVQADGDLVFLTMELLQGHDLWEEIKTRRDEERPFSVEEVLDIAADVTRALAYAHKSLVHRDIKPGNVFLCDDGTRKLMDFGIARQEDGADLTLTGQVMGTLKYMAPEQRASSKDADHRADQYAVGLILWELLAGAYPVKGIVPIRQVRPNVPKKLAAAIDRSLADDPDKRFADTASFAAALAAAGVAHTRRKIHMAVRAVVLLAVVGVLAARFLTAGGGAPEEGTETARGEDTIPIAGTDGRAARDHSETPDGGAPGLAGPAKESDRGTDASATDGVPDDSTPATPDDGTTDDPGTEPVDPVDPSGAGGGGGEDPPPEEPAEQDLASLPPEELGERLREAARLGDLAVAEELLAAGAPVDLADREGFTALLRAASAGRDEVALLLLERGADPELAVKSQGRNALHLAAWKGRTAIVDAILEVLRARHADPKALDRAVNARDETPDFRTAFDLARRAGHDETAGVLEAAGGKE